MSAENEFLSTETPFMPDEKIEVSKAVVWLKQQRRWLLQMQQLHGINAAAIQRWLDLFDNECTCRGKQEHDSLSDVMQHFNDWLKIKTDRGRKTAKKEAKRENDPPGPPDYQKRWTMCQAELCQSVSPEEAAQTYALMRYELFNPKENYILIQVPSNEVFERLESNCVETLSLFINKYFGNCRLKYRITGK